MFNFSLFLPFRFPHVSWDDKDWKEFKRVNLEESGKKWLWTILRYYGGITVNWWFLFTSNDRLIVSSHPDIRRYIHMTSETIQNFLWNLVHKYHPIGVFSSFLFFNSLPSIMQHGGLANLWLGATLAALLLQQRAVLRETGCSNRSSTIMEFC